MLDPTVSSSSLVCVRELGVRCLEGFRRSITGDERILSRTGRSWVEIMTRRAVNAEPITGGPLKSFVWRADNARAEQMGKWEEEPMKGSQNGQMLLSLFYRNVSEKIKKILLSK